VTRNAHPFSRGFTLTEIVLSMALMTTVMAGTTSVILIASHALPGAQNPGQALTDSSDVVGQIAGELAYASSVTEKSASAVTFTVADRGHGGAGPETIRYAWSATSGDPLTRQYNGGSVVPVAEDVSEFDLSYDLKVVTEQGDPVTNESAEVLLISQDTSVALTDFAITDKDWIGQYFLPPLPADAFEWRVTRVKFKARVHGGTNGITAVQLRLPAAGNLPSATVLEMVPMYEDALGASYLWEEFSFASVSGLSPSQGLCLVLAVQKKDPHLADIQYDDASGSGRLTTTDKGTNWNYDAGKSMLYYVYGTVTTLGPPEAVTRQWLLSAGIKLRVGPDPSTRVETEVQVLNVPEVTGS
jgi:hypothetical protein